MIPSAYGTTPGTILPSNYGLLSSVGGMSGGMAGGLSGGMYGGMYGGTYGGVGSPYTVCPSPRLSMLPPNDKAEDKKEAKKEEKAPKAVINITTTGWEQPIEDMKETMKELEQEVCNIFFCLLHLVLPVLHSTSPFIRDVYHVFAPHPTPAQAHRWVGWVAGSTVTLYTSLSPNARPLCHCPARVGVPEHGC